MRLTINGEQKEVRDDVKSIDALLGSLSINKQATAVELNGKIMGQNEWDASLLTGGDKIEIITFVGGG